MRLCPIASGSSGNCTYVGSESTHLLVDAGISGKRIREGLNGLGIDGQDVSGIFITHEHIDHISGLGVIVRKYGIPIYATKPTLNAIKRDKRVGAIDESMFRSIELDKDLRIGDITVNPLHISHDAADPAAYRFSDGKKRVAVATDIGCYNDYTIRSLYGMDALVLEANHDVRMLQTGPYPYYLQQRILGDRGHLSNENSGKLLSCIAGNNIEHVALGHLSAENNYPELAFEAVRLELKLSDTPFTGEDFHIQVAKRSELSECMVV